MSHRQVRKSTSDLRRFYFKNKRRSLHERPLTTIRDVQEILPDHEQVINMPGEGDAQPAEAIPGTSQDIPVQLAHQVPLQDPQGQQGQPGGHLNPPHTPQQIDPQLDSRLKNIEDMLKEWKENRSPTATRERATRPNTPARSSKSRRSPSRRRSGSRRHSSGRSGRSTRSPSRSHHSRRSSSKSRRRSSGHRHRRSSYRSRSSRSKSGHRSRRSRSRSRSRDRRRDTISPPTRPRRKSTSAEKLSRALESQYPTIGRPKGRPLPKSGLTLEPYRNLPPEIRKRASKRKSRRDLLFPEHMCGFLNTILKSVDQDSELFSAVEHAAQVAEDASTLCWIDVREWSQACLAHVEQGASWLDRPLFEKDRTKISWVQGRSRDTTTTPLSVPSRNLTTQRVSNGYTPALFASMHRS